MKHDATKSPKQFDLALGEEDHFELSRKLNSLRKKLADDGATDQELASAGVVVAGKLILQGIYTLDGDKLTYCVSAVGASRPDKFAVSKGSGQTLVKLERFRTGEADIESALTKLKANLSKDDVGYITSVDFRNSRVTNDDLKVLQRLKKLTRVTLTDTAIGDAGLLHLGAVENLQDLQIGGTQVTDDGLAHLQSLDLRTLYLSDTAISDAGLLQLREFDKLYNLHLSRTSVTDEGMRTLQTLPRLDSVFLEGTDITDAGVAHLVRQARLSGVRLAGTKVTDAGVKQLLYLPRLGNVSLGGTQATDRSLGYLRKARKLRYLSLTPMRSDKRGVGEIVKAEQRLNPKRGAAETSDAEPQFSRQAIRKLQNSLPKLRIQ